MTTWDIRFLQLAALVASWSKSQGMMEGAVLVDSEHRIVSIGFAGFPRGVRDESDAVFDRAETRQRTIHAAENALLFAGRPVEGCTLYVTSPPCAHCAVRIVQAGVARVITRTPAEGYRAHRRVAAVLFIEADIRFEHLNID